MLESSGSASLCFHKASLLLVIFLNSLFSYQGSCVALASDSYNIAVLFPFVNNFFKKFHFLFSGIFLVYYKEISILHLSGLETGFWILEADTLLKYPDTRNKCEKVPFILCNLDKTSLFPVLISIFPAIFLQFCHLQLIAILFLDIWNCLTSHISKTDEWCWWIYKMTGSFGYFFRNVASYIQFLKLINANDSAENTISYAITALFQLTLMFSTWHLPPRSIHLRQKFRQLILTFNWCREYKIICM